jgi:hypothetical protein
MKHEGACHRESPCEHGRGAPERHEDTQRQTGRGVYADPHAWDSSAAEKGKLSVATAGTGARKGNMRLTPVDRERIAALRDERRRDSSLAVVPGFYSRLSEEAQAHLVQETGDGVGPLRDLGYVLSLERPHDGHSHVTVIELHLLPASQTRYEDVLDLLKERLRPRAYLVRTDDCRLTATLLARGYQVEATALVLLPEEGGRRSGGIDRTAPAGAVLVRLGREHLPGLREVLDRGGPHEHGRGADRHGGSHADAAFAELETLAWQEGNWALLQHDRPVAVIARLEGGDGVHELLDFAVAQASEADLAWALGRATETVWSGGRRPAAVIDATEAARRRIFRAAGYYSAAAYMVFYDAEAGRPSVGTVSIDELRAMIERRERFHLVDVLGEDHWREGHLPGSEWIDFKGLAREARRRFRAEEPIVVYCNGFT